MWLSNKILSWTAHIESSTREDKQGVHRPYEIWGHAEALLNSATNSFQRVDAITTIKRSIDHRLRYLQNLYRFDGIPIKDKPKRIVEQLGYFGIVRPTMLKQILLLRNQMEHADAPPPDQSRCSEFLDFAWYFLRSTEGIARSAVTTLMLEPSESVGESYYWVEVDMGPHMSWKVSLRGWMPHRLFSKTEHKDWVNLDVERLETRKDYLDRLQEVKLDSGTQGKNPTDVYFNGVMNGPE